MTYNIENTLIRKIIALESFLRGGKGEGLDLGWFKNLEDGLIGELGRIHINFPNVIAMYPHGIISSKTQFLLLNGIVKWSITFNDQL